MGLLTGGSVIFTWILFISTVQGIREGHDATLDQFPYHVHIEVYDKHLYRVALCNGVLMTDNLVITSYDCVWRGTRFLIAVGLLNPFNEDPEQAHLTEKRFYAPPGIASSNSLTIHNYIALLQMETKLHINDHLKSRLGLPIGNRLFANATGYPDGKNHLQWLYMRKVKRSECAEHFPEDLLKHSICAQGEDAEGNKSGSLCGEANFALVHKSTLLGILKKTDEPCTNDGPSLFIRVPYFSSWINNTINNIYSGLAMHDATETEFPYHAHIAVYNSSDFNTNDCSGAVINSKFVITSKDCVSNGSHFRIRLGSLNPGDAEYNHVTKLTPFLPPETIIKNPWQPDIRNPLIPALVEVQEEIIFSDHIRPVSLPNLENSLHAPDYYAFATGYYSSDGLKHLQSFHAQVVHISECIPHFNKNLSHGSLCVLSERAIHYNETGSLCNDQGVPLVLNSDRKTLVGISTRLANEVTCRNRGHTNLFVDLRPFVAWIEDTIDPGHPIVSNDLR